jgi:hypothetical protein
VGDVLESPSMVITIWCELKKVKRSQEIRNGMKDQSLSISLGSVEAEKNSCLHLPLKKWVEITGLHCGTEKTFYIFLSVFLSMSIQ